MTPIVPAHGRLVSLPHAGHRLPRLLSDRIDAALLVTLAAVALAVRAIPVLLGGGLFGLLAYDDGVYFGAALAFVHGVVPYRDFLLLHPPGIVVALSPFAMLGGVIGDAQAFALARGAIMLLGAANAILVALVAGRYGRFAGVVAGAVYAVWGAASLVERTTDFHGPQNTLLLLGLLALSRPGRIGPRRAAIAGVVLGLAMAIQLWQVIAVGVVLWWVVVRARGDGWARLQPAVAYIAGAGIAFGLICLPFFLSAPAAMVRYLIVDQLGRPNQGVGVVERLRALEGQLPPALRDLVPDPLVVAAATVAVILVLVTAWRCPWTRLWAVLATVETLVLFGTPAFHDDYPSLVVPAASLVLGTGVAVGAGRLVRRGVPRMWVGIAIAMILVPLAITSVAHRMGERLPLADLDRDISPARCVTSDSPALLVLTSAMRHDLEAGCPIIVDPTGVLYDTDPGRHRSNAPGYQAAMTEWYASGDVALFAQEAADDLTPATLAAIDRRLPVERQRGIVRERLSAAP